MTTEQLEQELARDSVQRPDTATENRIREMLKAMEPHPSRHHAAGVGDGVNAVLIRNGQPILHRRQNRPLYAEPGDSRFAGRWTFGLYRPDKYGQMQQVMGNHAPNLIVSVGKAAMLNVFFNSGTQIVQTNWFAGLISNTSFSTIVPGDTMGSHGGWTEFTNYSQTARVAWGPGTPTTVSGTTSITNASPITFNITATGIIKGLFIVGGASGADTKGGGGGTLWSAAQFVGGDVSVVNGDELRASYTVNC